MPAEPPKDPGPDTTYYVRKALEGDDSSREWIVSRFTPLLRAQATYRLGPTLAEKIPVDDIVAEAWLATLPKLGQLNARDERYTPVLLAYLGVTVRRLANRRLEQFARRQAREGGPDVGTDEVPMLDRISDHVRGVVTQSVQMEKARAILQGIQALEDRSREVVLLRGVEGFSYDKIAAELGDTPANLRQRYRRAIQQLRAALPSTVFDELTDT